MMYESSYVKQLFPGLKAFFITGQDNAGDDIFISIYCALISCKGAKISECESFAFTCRILAMVRPGER